MAFPKAVEKLRPMVLEEISRLKAPIPAELPLSVIRWESGGKTGVVNKSSGASGLTQVMPIALKEYNNHHSQKYTMSDLRDKTARGARIQIRVGLWIMGHFWKNAHRYLKDRLPIVPIDQLVKIADVFYAAGPANAKRKLDKIDATFEALAARHPDWSAIGHAKKVWSLAMDNGANWATDEIGRWLDGEVVIEDDKNKKGAFLVIVAIALAWYLFKKGKI